MRKKRRANRARPNGAPESPYPADTPIEESTGLPKTEASISEETAKRIGFDPASARKRKQFKDVLEARAGGVRNVKWNADPQVKYVQMFAVHPDAKVTVKQIEPVVDESLDDQFVKVLPDYGALRKYIKDNHWRGDKATYQFSFSSAAHPVIGEGKVYFNEDPEWAERKEEEMARRQQPQGNPQYGPQGYGQPPQAQGGYPPPGYGGYPPPGYGYPPPGYGPPQVTVVQPQHIPPMPQPSPMPAAPAPSAGMEAFVQYLIQQGEWSRQEMERLRTYAQQLQQQVQQPQQQATSPQDWFAWLAAERKRWEDEQALKLAALAKPEPPPPVDPLVQMKSTLDMIQSVTKMKENLVGAPKEEASSKEKEDDDGFPVAIKRVGPINIIADKKSGEIIQDPMLNAMFNGGNIEDAIKRVTERAEKFFEKRTKDNEEANDKQLELERIKLEQIREKAAANRAAVEAELKIAEARRLALGPAPAQQPLPEAIPMTQAHAEKIAQRPAVDAVVVRQPAPPPWVVGKAPLPETPSPAERPASSSETRPEQVDTPVKTQPEHRNESPEDPEGNGSGPVVSAGEDVEEETVPDTEPPPAPVPEPAAEPTELRTN